MICQVSHEPKNITCILITYLEKSQGVWYLMSDKSKKPDQCTDTDWCVS